jgi:hypothetical protein
MKRGAWGILLVLAIMTTNTDAAKWNPYFQGAFIVNQATPMWSIDMDAESSQWLPISLSRGEGLELGMSSHSTDIYVGYQIVDSYFSSDKIVSNTYYRYEKDQWKERRCLFGCRYRWVRQADDAVIPAVGGAVSIGRSVWDHEYTELYNNEWFGWNGESYETNRRAKIGIGLMGECGVVFLANSPVNILTLAQVQWYERRFDSDAYRATPERVTVESIVYTLSVRYTINRKHH